MHTQYNKNAWRETELSEKDENPHYKYTLQSVFCLQPVGDLPTRKGLFDAIMFGCIPVVFHPLSASAMYTWHWSTQLWKDIAIEIPMNVMNHTRSLLLSDPIVYLKDLKVNEPEAIARRQKLLRRHAFELSYSLDFYQPGSPWPLDEEDRPVRDAYEITMDALLGKNSGTFTEKPRVVESIWKKEVVKLVPDGCRSLFRSRR